MSTVTFLYVSILMHCRCFAVGARASPDLCANAEYRRHSVFCCYRSTSSTPWSQRRPGAAASGSGGSRRSSLRPPTTTCHCPTSWTLCTTPTGTRCSTLSRVKTCGKTGCLTRVRDEASTAFSSWASGTSAGWTFVTCRRTDLVA